MSTEQHDLNWQAHPLRELLRLTWPIAVSTLSYSIMTLVDTLLVGHLGPSALAGVGLAGTATFAVLCFSIGLLRGAKTLVSQAVGARRPDLVNAYRAAALGAAVVLGVLTIGVGQIVAELLVHLSATVAAGEAARTYLHIRNLVAPVVLVGVALREVGYAEGDSQSPMLATIAANIVNVALAVLFVFGLHRGVAGAATATAIASVLETAILWRLGARRGVRVGRAALVHVRELWRIGLPTALQFMLEIGSFTLLASMISSLSETQMAAHQIALQICQFSFLPAWAVAEAAAVMAGQAIGARRDALVMRVARLALYAAGGFTALASFVFATLAPLIVSGFTSDVALSSVAIRLLHVAAVFQLFDGANIVARAILRGVGDVRFAAVVGVVTAWLMTPPLTWLLGWRAGLGAYGGWIGLCAETIVGAFILWHRLARGRWLTVAVATRQATELPAADLVPALVANG
jgi:MATE family multidrug resistance protein